MKRFSYTVLLDTLASRHKADDNRSADMAVSIHLVLEILVVASLRRACDAFSGAVTYRYPGTRCRERRRP